MAPFPVDASGGDGQGCARLGAGGTPALPGSPHPMTSSPQGHKMAEAFWCRLTLKEVHLSSCLFVSIRGSSSSTISRFSSNDPHSRAGARLRANGSFPKGGCRLSEKSPARHSPRHRRDCITRERGRPARILFLITRERGRPARILSLITRERGRPARILSLITRERGRPARILFLWPPLSFSAMLQAATLWAGTASARPKESHGAVPG